MAHDSDAARDRLPSWVLVMVAPAAFLISFVLLSYLATRLAQAGIFNRDNIAFDLDSHSYFGVLLSDHPDSYGMIKHPLLAFFFRPVLRVTAALMGDPARAATLVMSALGATSITLALAYFRATGMGVLDSVIGTTVFAGAASVLFFSSQLDSYVFSLPILILGLLLFERSLRGGGGDQSVLACIAIVAFCITVTNVVPIAWLSLISRVRTSRSIAIACRRFAWWCAWVGIGIAALLLFAYWRDLGQFLRDPVFLLKQAYWNGVGASSHTEKAGLVRYVANFLVYPVVAPRPTTISIEDGAMLDFRAASFTMLGAIAAALWIGAICLAVIAAARDASRAYPRLLAIAGWLAFNFLLHLVYQFRGSVFLYSVHWLPPLCLFVLALALGGHLPVNRNYVRVGCLLLAFAVLVNNLSIAAEVASKVAAITQR